MAKKAIIYGFHAVSAALEHQPATLLNLYYEEKMHSPRLQIIADLAQSLGYVLQPLSRTKLEALAQTTNHQGIVAQIKQSLPTEQAFFDWLSNTNKVPLLLLLEGIQDPHNLGACLRSAEAFGVDWVIITKHQSASLTGTVSKVASGAMQTLPVLTVTNVVRFIKEMKERGVWVVGTAGQASQSLMQGALTRSLALVMGAEETGLKQSTLENCDELVKIPLAGTVESLNVSAAAAISLYECLRQRGTLSI